MAELELTEEDLERVRARALAAGPLPDDVRRRLVQMLELQAEIQRLVVDLNSWSCKPNLWVVRHVVPSLSWHLTTRLAALGKPASTDVAMLLPEVSEMALIFPVKATDMLLKPSASGPGGSAATRARADLLRVLDFGLLGFPGVAAVFATTLGLKDISTNLVAQGRLTVSEACEAAAKLGEPVLHDLSPSDDPADLSVPLSVLKPDDLNALQLLREG